MLIHRKEGLQLLTEEMQTSIDTNWKSLSAGIFMRDSKHKHGIDVFSDKPLQALINEIYKGFMPVFAQKAWAQYEYIKTCEKMGWSGEPEELRKATDDATDVIIFYANSAYGRLKSHFSKGMPGRITAENNAYNLLGSIISSATTSFNHALYKYDSAFEEMGVEVQVPKNESEVKSPQRYLERHRKFDSGDANDVSRS